MNKQSIGLFELVLFGFFAIGVYALIERNVRKHEPATPPPPAAQTEPAAEPVAEPTPEPEPEPEVVVEPDPEPPSNRLGQDDVEAAMRAVRPAVDACQRRHPATGVMWVDLEVGTSGRVTRVKIDDTPDDGLGRCVATALKKMKLPKSDESTSVSFPIRFE